MTSYSYYKKDSKSFLDNENYISALSSVVTEAIGIAISTRVKTAIDFTIAATLSTSSQFTVDAAKLDIGINDDGSKIQISIEI